MALPQFQRDFVWDPNKVIELLDSISHGWPIGSLLLLEGPQAFETKDFKDGPTTSREKVQYYVLDGQQRLTSIYHAVSDRSDVVYLVNLDADENEAEATFTWVKRDKQPSSRPSPTYPLAGLIDEASFKSTLRGLSSIDVARLSRARKEKLGYLLGGQYRTPATLMRKGIELEALARIFETINRTGVKLDAFDLMVSVLYPKNFHLRDRWDEAEANQEILAEMKSGGLEILKLIALWRRDIDENSRSPRRVTGVRQRDVLNIPASFVIDWWPPAVAAYCRGLSALRAEFGVQTGASKPSDAMVLTLAYELDQKLRAEFKIPLKTAEASHAVALVMAYERKADRVNELDPDLRRWYWQAIVDQRYAQGANTQILTDIRQWPALTGNHRNLDDLLSGTLNDPARRNRILRLGIQGLLMKRAARDPVTSEPLKGELEELSISELALPLPEDVKVETLTVDNLLLNHGSTRGLRERMSALNAQPLDERALESQGFPPRLGDLQLEDCREERVRALIEWFGELT